LFGISPRQFNNIKKKYHYKEYSKKLKDTEILPDIIEKFGISSIQFKRIKNKFKES
jgi:hypothetical protein